MLKRAELFGAMQFRSMHCRSIRQNHFSVFGWQKGIILVVSHVFTTIFDFYAFEQFAAVADELDAE